MEVHLAPVHDEDGLSLYLRGDVDPGYNAILDDRVLPEFARVKPNSIVEHTDKLSSHLILDILLTCALARACTLDKLNDECPTLVRVIVSPNPRVSLVDAVKITA